MIPLHIHETPGPLPRLLISSARISLMWGRKSEGDVGLSPTTNRERLLKMVVQVYHITLKCLSSISSWYVLSSVCKYVYYKYITYINASVANSTSMLWCDAERRKSARTVIIKSQEQQKRENKSADFFGTKHFSRLYFTIESCLLVQCKHYKMWHTRFVKMDRFLNISCNMKRENCWV